jgi:carboxypeptidase PM20D1
MLWSIIVIVLAALIAAAVLTVVIRTALFRPAAKAPDSAYVENDDPAGAGKLAEAVRLRTVSYIDPSMIDRQAFLDFHKLLEKQFPLVHRRCEKTVINTYSLVYHLKSGNPEPKGKPILITAHMDVVPVEEGTESAWNAPPFDGVIKDGILVGRGTLDTKAHLIGAMEALERLLAKGFEPARDIFFAFGHDEELSGQEGAKQIAAYLKDAGLSFDFVLDEGGCVATNVIPGVDKPIALVGVGEKGYTNVRLTAARDGGHSSMPAPHTSLGVIAEALCRLENHPYKPRLIGTTRAFLMRIGPHMKGINRVILANLWLFKPLFLRVFAKSNTGSAMLRTSLAATMAQGSPAPNVVPQKSTAVVNARIMPGENGETLMAHFRSVTKGLGVELGFLTQENPSAISPIDTDAFRTLEGLIGAFCSGAVVAPYLVMAGTDAKKYECVCKNIYRFTPYVIDNADVGTIHSTNESISVVNVNRCIDFFTALMERL